MMVFVIVVLWLAHVAFLLGLLAVSFFGWVPQQGVITWVAFCGAMFGSLACLGSLRHD